MITMVECKNGEGMTFRTVSLQGVQLSATQRLRADQRARLQASMRSHLDLMVDEGLAAVAKLKEQGEAKPFRQWTVIQQESGTPYLGDVFGYPDPFQPGNSAQFN